MPSLHHSVGRRLRTHCYKGDTSSQWRMSIFGHLVFRNPWTDFIEIWLNWLCLQRYATCQKMMAVKNAIAR